MDEELMKLRVKNAIKNIDYAINDLADVKKEDFVDGSLLSRAVSFSLMQIGEQIARIKEKYGDLFPEIEWNKAKSLRNMLVHDYVEVDLDRVYDTVKNDLPRLKEQLQSMLD